MFMRKIFVVQCHPWNIFNVEVFLCKLWYMVLIFAAPGFQILEYKLVSMLIAICTLHNKTCDQSVD